jgi:ATP-dependent Clp protease protease subunit
VLQQRLLLSGCGRKPEPHARTLTPTTDIPRRERCRPPPAAVLLAAGTTGKRAALPHSRIVIHQSSTEGGYGQTSDMEIQAQEIIRLREQLETILARHSGRPVEQVRADIERDRYLTAEEAREYGLIDEIITSRKPG